MNSHDPIPLDDAAIPVQPGDDRRPRMPEPLPVRLMTVEDARLVSGLGLADKLDAFYAGLLGFEKENAAFGLVYRAENFRLMIDWVDTPVNRDNMRAIGIEVLDLLAAEHSLVDAEIDYVRQRGLLPGQESLLLRDPAGNWVELTESRKIG